MFVRLENFESGWSGISIELKTDEVSAFIDRLHQLLNGEIGHFHFRANDFADIVGVADIEISLSQPDCESNMSID
jgi:hypothetical protein